MEAKEISEEEGRTEKISAETEESLSAKGETADKNAREEGTPEDGGEKKHLSTGMKVLIAASAVATAVLLFVGGWYAKWFSLGENARALLWAVDIAEKNFYEEVSEDEIYDALLEGFPNALDKYSQYFSNDAYDVELDRTAGRSAGYGISVWTNGNRTQFYSIVGNSPSERAGLRKGMYLFGFGESAEALHAGTQQEFDAFLDETEGPAVLKCGYLADASDAKIYTVTPAAYQTSYCLYRDMGGSYRFDPNDLSKKFELGEPLTGADADTAYIRIEKFYGKAAEEFRSCLSLMKEQGRSKLILDLRGNGGGYLSVFTEIAAHLLKNAEGSRPVVATTRYRDGSESRYYAPANDYSTYFDESAKVVLLADASTASASECLIGALISYGTLNFGDIYLRKSGNVAKTLGKGIMQSTYTDIWGNAMKLTVAKIYWPNGKSIHNVGVTEADGAVAIEAGSYFTATDDAMLSEVIERLKV